MISQRIGVKKQNKQNCLSPHFFTQGSKDTPSNIKGLSTSTIGPSCLTCSQKRSSHISLQKTPASVNPQHPTPQFTSSHQLFVKWVIVKKTFFSNDSTGVTLDNKTDAILWFLACLRLQVHMPLQMPRPHQTGLQFRSGFCGWPSKHLWGGHHRIRHKCGENMLTDSFVCTHTHKNILHRISFCFQCVPHINIDTHPNLHWDDKSTSVYLTIN